MFRRTAVAALAVVAGLATVVVASRPAGATLAPSSVERKVGPAVSPAVDSPIEGNPLPLPFGTFSRILVDQADSQIFYSGAASGVDGAVGGVAVSSLTGTNLRLISGTTDAAGMTIGPDGLLYVAESTDNVIVAIDRSTLTVTHSYPTGTDACPSTIAFAGTELWFSFSCTADPSLSGIAELDRGTGTVTNQGDPTYSFPQLAAVPGHPDELLSTWFGGVPELDLLQVSGTTATPTPNVVAYTDATNLDVSPDGSSVLANGTAYSTVDLTPGTTYTPGSGVPAMTGVYDADGSHVAVSNDSLDVSVFLADGTELHHYVSPGSQGAGDASVPAHAGLAWVGSSLVSVFVDAQGLSPQVRLLTDALTAPSTITLTAPATTRRGVSFSFTGTFANVQDPTGLQLSVSRRDASGLVGLTPITLGADGTFTVTDTPPVGSTNVYTVSYVGSPRYGPAKTAVAITVSRDVAGLSVHTDQTVYPVGATMTVTIHLGAHYNLAQVSLYATPAGSYQRLVARPTVDAAGNAVVRVKYSYSTSFIATYAGDYRYAPTSTSTSARVQVRLTPSLRGGYAISGGYTLFHAGSYATSGAQVLPLKPGQCVSFALQYYSGGQWLNGVGLPCGRLSSASVVAASFTERAGVPWRLQLAYRTDTTNTGAASSWIYLRWV